MDLENLVQEVIAIVAQQAMIEENCISLETNLSTDFEFDSLDITELVMACERHFQISIELGDAKREEINTVADLVVLVLLKVDFFIERENFEAILLRNIMQDMRGALEKERNELNNRLKQINNELARLEKALARLKKPKTQGRLLARNAVCCY